MRDAVTSCVPKSTCKDGPYGPIGSWDISSVTDMSHMFDNARWFNGDLSNWDVSSVTDMSNMFGGAHAFNGDIANWDVSSVTNMHSMFMKATSFNRDLSNWDVSSVTDMSMMFYFAKSFAQVLCGAAWFDSSANKDSIFEGSRGLLSKACLSTTTHTMSTSVITPGPMTCSKCVTNKAGKSTCCARGGSWFQKCGGPGDSKFDHTWAEGIEACKCTMVYIWWDTNICVLGHIARIDCMSFIDPLNMCTTTATRTVGTTSIPAPITCSKCVTNNAGKLTCCNRGGSWFQKCGRPGDSKFDHTWVEGLLACKCTMVYIWWDMNICVYGHIESVDCMSFADSHNKCTLHQLQPWLQLWLLQPALPPRTRVPSAPPTTPASALVALTEGLGS